ncbi:MAG: hypothetical protein EP310_00900 [Bacteroidetes bacterium]|nr:MAG: hypothetical protein EP310_00900 [Bacteroidota bacterium]
MKTISYLYVLVFLTSCLGDVENYRNNLQSDIEIYIIKEGQLTIHDSDFDLNSLQPESQPWVKSSEIELYDWSSHTFYLKKPVDKGKYSGRHFVVVSGDERLFAGIFFPMYMSSFPQLPSIIPEDDLFSPKDVILFGQFGHQFPTEQLKSDKFKKALFDAGLLSNGINVDLKQLKSKGENAVEYTFEVTNCDTETLYIPDPDKMGDSRFHYITNGVWFFTGNTYCYSNLSDHTSFENFSESWFYKLKPGQKMTRTVEQSGFSCALSGKVNCRFSFPGAKIKTGEWKKPDGRVWIGNFYVEKEMVINYRNP